MSGHKKKKDKGRDRRGKRSKKMDRLKKETERGERRIEDLEAQIEVLLGQVASLSQLVEENRVLREQLATYAP
jgi:uncharacterized protein YaaN involved in tellurite resistance